MKLKIIYALKTTDLDRFFSINKGETFYMNGGRGGGGGEGHSPSPPPNETLAVYYLNACNAHSCGYIWFTAVHILC